MWFNEIDVEVRAACTSHRVGRCDYLFMLLVKLANRHIVQVGSHVTIRIKPLQSAQQFQSFTKHIRSCHTSFQMNVFKHKKWSTLGQRDTTHFCIIHGDRYLHVYEFKHCYFCTDVCFSTWIEFSLKSTVYGPLSKYVKFWNTGNVFLVTAG